MIVCVVWVLVACAPLCIQSPVRTYYFRLVSVDIVSHKHINNVIALRCNRSCKFHLVGAVVSHKEEVDKGLQDELVVAVLEHFLFRPGVFERSRYTKNQPINQYAMIKALDYSNHI